MMFPPKMEREQSHDMGTVAPYFRTRSLPSVLYLKDGPNQGSPVGSRPGKLELGAAEFFFFFNWWIIVLQRWVGFCHTAM